MHLAECIFIRRNIIGTPTPIPTLSVGIYVIICEIWSIERACLDNEKTLQSLELQGFSLGTRSGARTLDTLIKSQVLYQLS